MNKLFGVALLSAILLSGCGESTAKEVKKEPKAGATHATADKKPAVEQKAPKQPVVKETKTEKQKVEKQKAKKHKSIPKTDKLKSKAKVKQKTKTASKPIPKKTKISTDGKAMLLLFGQNSDPYTQKIKDDIVSDDELSKRITSVVTPIYIDARGQKKHKFQHNGEIMDVDTKTLVSIYNVTATPTLIFADREASHIFVVPGYMPPKQFKVTLDFVEQGLWRGKDRKNGDVYAALKKFYADNGVEIKVDSK